jgi:hypothetical protein
MPDDRLLVPPIRTALSTDADGKPVPVLTEKQWYLYWRDTGNKVNEIAVKVGDLEGTIGGGDGGGGGVILGPLTAITGAGEVGARYVHDPERLVHLTIGFVPVGPTPQDVTFLVSDDAGATWVWIGAELMTAAGQQILVDRLAPVDDGLWQVAAVAGNLGGTPVPLTNSKMLAKYPGAVKSALFTVAGLATPPESQGITATIGDCTNVVTSDGLTQYGRIPGVIYTDPLDSLDFSVKITVRDLDATFAPISEEKIHSNVGITGEEHTIGELLVTYRPGLAYIQYKFYVANRGSQSSVDFGDSKTNTLQLVSFNGAAPAHSYEVPITIPPFEPIPSGDVFNVLSVAGRECGPKYQDEKAGLHTVVALAPVIDVDFTSPHTVTFWLDFGNGVPVWQGWYSMSFLGQEIKIGEQTLGADGTRNSGDIWVPVNTVLGNWRVWCGPGRIDKGVDPTGYPNSGFTVIPIRPCSATAITDCHFVPDPDTGDLISYSKYDPGIWYWEYYRLQWIPPTLAAEPDFWFTQITVQKGATIGGVWTPAPDYEGRNTDPYANFLGRLHDEVHTPAGLANDQTVIMQRNGAHPATWDIPPAHESDLVTVNPYREYRFLMYAVSRLGIDASGSGADRTYTLQTSCWPGGTDHYILIPAAKNGDLNLSLANPASITGPLTGGNGQPLTILPGAIEGTYIKDDAILAQHMHEDSITAANKALAANSIVDLNVNDVNVSKLIAGTNIFTGDVILSRGSAKPVIILQNSGINLFGVSTGPGNAGLTSSPNVAIQSGGISLFSGNNLSATITSSAITFWAVNGSLNNPYVTVSATGIVLSDGSTPTPNTFTLDSTGFTIADKNGAKITVKAGVLTLTTPLTTPAGAFATALMDGNGLKFSTGTGATYTELKMDNTGIAISKGSSSVTITASQVNIVNGVLTSPNILITGSPFTIAINSTDGFKVTGGGIITTINHNVGSGGTAAGVQISSVASPNMKIYLQPNGLFLYNTAGTLVGGFNLDTSDRGRLYVSSTVNADIGVFVASNQVLRGRMPGPGYPGDFTDPGNIRLWCIALYEALSATGGGAGSSFGPGHGLFT